MINEISLFKFRFQDAKYAEPNTMHYLGSLSGAGQNFSASVEMNSSECWTFLQTTFYPWRRWI